MERLTDEVGQLARSGNRADHDQNEIEWFTSSGVGPDQVFIGGCGELGVTTYISGRSGT